MAGRVTMEFQHLWLAVSLFIFIVFLLSQTNVFRQALSETVTSWKSRILFAAVFSMIGILGTYWGIRTDDGIINSRSVGVIVGGIIGGPFVGLCVGVITGVHRMFFPDTFTAMASGIITILQGTAAGLLSSFIKSRHRMWPWAFGIGFLFESLHMMFLFLFAGPPERVLHFVQVLAPSMITNNSIAIGLFIGMLERSMKQREIDLSNAAKSTFRTVHLILNVLKSGVSGASAKNVTQIIASSIPGLSWAAILAAGKVQAMTVNEGETGEALTAEIERWSRLPENEIPEELGIMAVPVSGNSVFVDQVLVRKSGAHTFSGFEKELITGMKGILEMVIEFDRLKKQASMMSLAEIKMLQAQINPHFLFNAINTISYYCRSDSLMARQLLLNLGDYYRQNLSSPDSMIPLSEEINHIRAYVSIEQARFGNRLSVEYHLLPCDIHIPPLLLQPLVENAIRHGVLPRSDGGTVKIGVISLPRYYRMYVQDNGVGMTKTMLSSLLKEQPERKSIGLINVHQRLLSIYGKASGLHIQSQVNNGTVVFFLIPKNGKEVSYD